MYAVMESPFINFFYHQARNMDYSWIWIMKMFNQIGLLGKANGAMPSVLCLIMPMAI